MNYLRHKKETHASLIQCHKLIDPQGDVSVTWDEALRKGIQEYQNRSYNLFTCNCHSFVANSLNRLYYNGHDKWNVVSLATIMFLHGRFVNKRAMVKSFLPFFVVVGLGIVWGGSMFFIGLVAFALALTGWFLIGSYCFKNLVEL